MLPDPTTLLTAAAALAAVVALVLAAGRLAPRLGFAIRRGNGALRLEESLALDPRRRLHLVTCGNRRVLLLTGGGADVVVGWLARPPDAEREGAP